MPNKQANSLLTDLLLIEEKLKLDASKPYEELLQRDREIGVELEELSSQPVKQLRAWLKRSGNNERNDQRINHSFFLINCGLIVAGLFFGVSAGLGLFFYTGDQPINVINVLMIGIGLQLILLLLFIVSISFTSPWLQNFLGSFNAGRWAARLAYIFPSQRSTIDQIFNSSHDFANSKIVKWQTIYWSQLFALSFNLALLVSCFYLVTFTDLAFGWSSTLNLSNDIIKSITDLVSKPWHNLLPSAVPDLNLIETTRFYRLNTITSSASDSLADIAGNWWPFLLVSLFVYGLFPRLLTLFVAKNRLNRTISSSMITLPGANLLLDRMNRPSISTISTSPEVKASETEPMDKIEASIFTGRRVLSYHWGQPAFQLSEVSEWIERTTGAEIEQCTSVAIGVSDELPQIDSKTATINTVAIIAKAWEPPTLELTDWLFELKKQANGNYLIAIILYDLDENKTICQAGSIALKTWNEFLQRQRLTDIELHGVRS